MKIVAIIVGFYPFGHRGPDREAASAVALPAPVPLGLAEPVNNRLRSTQARYFPHFAKTLSTFSWRTSTRVPMGAVFPPGIRLPLDSFGKNAGAAKIASPARAGADRATNRGTAERRRVSTISIPSDIHQFRGNHELSSCLPIICGIAFSRGFHRFTT